MDDKIKKIKTLITHIFDQKDIYLIDIELRGRPNSQVLSIYADTEEGITLQQITDLSREIGDILDLEQPITGKYRLDVSSPGIDRPLKEAWQFRKNIGRELSVHYETEEGKKEIKGKLKDVQEQEIVLQNKKDHLKIPLDRIIRSVVKLNW